MAVDSGILLAIRVVKDGSQNGIGPPAIGGFVVISPTWSPDASPGQIKALATREQVQFDPGCSGNQIYPDCSQWEKKDVYRIPRLGEGSKEAYTAYPLDAETHQLKLEVPEESWLDMGLTGSGAAVGCNGWFVEKGMRVLEGEAEVLEAEGGHLLHLWGPASVEIEWSCF